MQADKKPQLHFAIQCNNIQDFTEAGHDEKYVDFVLLSERADYIGPFMRIVNLETETRLLRRSISSRQLAAICLRSKQ